MSSTSGGGVGIAVSSLEKGRGTASFSSGNRWGTCPSPSGESVDSCLLAPLDFVGDGSGFRAELAAGVVSVHDTKGRVSY